MLCVHGNPTWSYLWRRFLAAAPSGWRVVAVDQLGMGWSERLPQIRRLSDRIADLGDLTDALELDGPVVTVGHDWGGPISLGWALAHRDQVRGVVLANTSVHHEPGSAPPRLIRIARTPRMRDAVCVQTPIFVRAAAAFSRPALPADVRDALAQPYGRPELRSAVGDFVADIPLEPHHPSRATLDGIAAGVPGLADLPALVLWGARDPVFTEQHLRRPGAAAAAGRRPALRRGCAPGHRGRTRSGRARLALGDNAAAHRRPSSSALDRPAARHRPVVAAGRSGAGRGSAQ